MYWYNLTKAKNQFKKAKNQFKKAKNQFMSDFENF